MELTIDERDSIRDRVNYLKDLESNLWIRPGFDKLDDDLNEIRCRCNTTKKVIRLYGYFPDRRHHFTLLHGGEKKRSDDKHGKRVAKEHLKLLKLGRASIHEFDFEEKPDL